MGKINSNSGIEIIPLDDSSSSSHNQRGFTRSQTLLQSVQQHTVMHKMPYISDPTIVPRVQKVIYYL